MKYLKCNFYRTENVDTNAWENIIGKLQLDFITLCQDQLDPHYTAMYISHLFRHAKPLDKDPRMSFFGMAEPNTMPSDARVEYFYKPTYYAVAIMAKAAVIDSELLYGEPWSDGELEKNTLREIIASCLLGCTGREFKGHGFDDICGLVETMEIFADADMNTFIAQYPDLCPEFTKMYRDTLDFIAARVSEGKLAGSWGDDYTERGKAILEKNGIV